MLCPLPGCPSSESNVEVRYGARDVDCPSCGHFKISGDLYQSAQAEFGGEPEGLDKLKRFIRSRNAEGKVPVVTADNWRALAADA